MGKGEATYRSVELCATLQIPIASPRDAVPREDRDTGISLCRRFVVGFGDDPGASGVVCCVVLRGEDDAKDHDGENNNDEPAKGSAAESRPVRETVAVPIKSGPVNAPQLALVGSTLRLGGLVFHSGRLGGRGGVGGGVPGYSGLALRPEQGDTNRGRDGRVVLDAQRREQGGKEG